MDDKTASLLRKYKEITEPGKRAEIRAILIRSGVNPDYKPKKSDPSVKPDGRTPPDYVSI